MSLFSLILARHNYSSNDDIMARFLQEAKLELENEIKRSEQRTKPKRKTKTPPHSQPIVASTKSVDYPIVRLAPHRHILGLYLWLSYIYSLIDVYSVQCARILFNLFFIVV